MIKCHYYHIVSKVTLLSFILIFLLLFISNIMIADSIDIRQTNSLINEYYFINTFETIKLFSIILISFLYGYSFTKENDSYCYFVIESAVSRQKYILTKIFMLFSISFVLIISLCISFYVIPLIYQVSIKSIYFSYFLYLLILINYYGIISIILVIAFKSVYVILLPILFYILINSEITDSKIIKYLFLITISDNPFEFTIIGVAYLVFFIIVSTYVYKRIDI